MTRTELFYFTGKCLGLDNYPEFRAEIVQKIEAESVDWFDFVELCSNHLILPSVYLRFEKHGIISHLPLDLVAHLKMIFELNSERNSRILFQMGEVIKLLNSVDIFPIFLKGSGNLIDGLYSSVGERIMNDIDLLVSEADYLRTAKLLESNGYKADFEGIYDAVEDMKHYPSLVHPDFVTHIEVHQMPVSEKYRKWFNYQVIYQEKKAVSGYPGCFVLSDKHNIILNFIHGQLHHGGHIGGVISYRDMYDLHLLSQRIDPLVVLPEIKCKSKAKAYFKFTEEAIGLNRQIGLSKNVSFRILKKKHNLNMTSPVFYNANRTFTFLNERFERYYRNLRRFMFSNSGRKALIRRLKNPEWYTHHFNMYINFFGRK